MSALERVDCLFPSSIDEAIAFLKNDSESQQILAGGTDLLAQWQTGVTPPKAVVSVSGISELKEIRKDNGNIIIGAGVTHAQLRDSALIRQYLPALSEAASLVGGPQIQARGTIGGNVANASPAADLAPALLVTGGSVVMAGPTGERSSALTSFFQGYRKIDLQQQELIARFVLPQCPMTAKESFRKIGTRRALAISKVMAACRIDCIDNKVVTAAIAVGSVAPTAIRLTELETWLVGQELSEAVIAEAESMATNIVFPIDDIRSTTAYRKWIAGRLVRGFLSI